VLSFSISCEFYDDARYVFTIVKHPCTYGTHKHHPRKDEMALGFYVCSRFYVTFLFIVAQESRGASKKASENLDLHAKRCRKVLISFDFVGFSIVWSWCFG
jgi:hypothetical protein